MCTSVCLCLERLLLRAGVQVSTPRVGTKRDDVAGGEPLGTAPPEPLVRMAVMPCVENEPLRLCETVGCRHLHREEVRQPELQPGLYLTRGEVETWRGQRSGHREQERAGHFASRRCFTTASFSSRRASDQHVTALACKRAQGQQHSRMFRQPIA